MSDSIRSLPNAEKAEEQIVSACLQEPEVTVARARSLGITKDTFYNPAYGFLFALAERAQRTGHADQIELLSLTQKLKDAGALENVGGASGLTTVYTAWIGTHDKRFDYYCEMLRDKHCLRVAILKCTDIITHSYEAEDSSEISTMIGGAMSDVLDARTETRRAVRTEQAMDEFVYDWRNRAAGDNAMRISTGIPLIDDATDGGLGKTWSVVIAGQTKSGKTMLATQIATNAILDNKKVVFFSMEMSKNELIERIIANIAEVPLSVMTNPHGNLSRNPDERTNQIRRVQEGVAKVRENESIWFLDDTRMDIDDLVDEVHTLNLQHNLDIVVADYVQLIKGTPGTSREREVAGVSAALKHLAMQNDIVTINLAQLNDEGKARESRAIFQDANLVLETSRGDGIRVVAQRQGDSGMELNLKLNGRFARFE